MLLRNTFTLTEAGTKALLDKMPIQCFQMQIFLEIHCKIRIRFMNKNVLDTYSQNILLSTYSI